MTDRLAATAIGPFSGAPSVSGAQAGTPDGETTKHLGWFFWICAGWIGLVIVLAILANVLPLTDPNFQNYNALNLGPGASHWLGTDDLGRDILSRVIFGSRVSLIIGFGAMAIGLLLGGLTGMIAGYRRGIIDTLVNAASYVLLAFPALVAVIAIVTFWGHDLWKIAVVLGVASAPLVFRLVRAATLSQATKEYVTAAKALGATDRRILWREILPNIFPAVLAFALIGVAVLIVLEGSLAFLGLSVPGPTASWGNMLNEGRSDLSTNTWVTLFPALAMFTFLLALNFVGDRLRQYFDVTEIKL